MLLPNKQSEDKESGAPGVGKAALAALRWLADQDAAFVMLDRDGSVLITTGPVLPSDARLRRAQALGAHSGADLRITRVLISAKLAGQERIARNSLNNLVTAETILHARTALDTAVTIPAIRGLEARAGLAYWSAWRDLAVNFPKLDLCRVPKHWRTFGTRVSPVSGSPRCAVNPPNAILNYLYAVLESESRLALATVGLDPGIGFLHVDSRTRDSLACDLMETVRPEIDSYVLDWLTHRLFRRKEFFEMPDGTCRLMAGLCAQLSETARTWASCSRTMGRIGSAHALGNNWETGKPASHTIDRRSPESRTWRKTHSASCSSAEASQNLQRLRRYLPKDLLCIMRTRVFEIRIR